MSRDSQSLSVREGAGYNEVFPLGHGPKEGLSWSSEKETSAHSPINKEEDCDGEEVVGDEDEYDEGERENKGDLEGEDDKNKDESDGGSFCGGKFNKSKGWSYSSLHSS